jgi:hypothetical protein
MVPGIIAFTSGIVLTFATGLTILLLLTPNKERPLRLEIVTYLTLALSLVAIAGELGILVERASSTEVVIVVLFTSVNVLFPIWMMRDLHKSMARILSPAVARTLMAGASLVATLTGILLGLLALVLAWLM